jgi:hypothetical protein
VINTGPQSLTLNVPTVVPNPLAEWGNAPTQVQVCNLSGFLINASAGGLVYMIQSYTALTLPLGQPGANLTMTPFSGTAAAPYNQVTETWLLSDETSPMPDGPLTASAIAAAIAGIVEITTTSFQAMASTSTNFEGFLLLNLGTITYPPNLVQANFQTAIVTFQNTTAASAPACGLNIASGSVGSAQVDLYQEAFSIPAHGVYTTYVPLAGVETLQFLGPAYGIDISVELTQEILPPGPAVHGWCPQAALTGASGAFVPVQVDPYGNQCVLAGTDGTNAIGLLTDTQGRLVLTPTAPSLAAGQHPVVERQWAANNFSANGNLGGPPGAGLRYRVYWAKLIYTGGTGGAYINGPYGGILCYVDSSPYLPLDFVDLKESGVAWPTNGPVTVAVSTGVGCEAAMLYTIETV